MTIESLRVIICDDQAVVREGLEAILSTIPHISVVGLASHGKEAIEMVEEHHPEIVIMDLNMPVMNGVQATRHIRIHHPDVDVLVLTTYAEDAWVFDAIRAGASGYLLKDTRREDLVKAIEGTAQGRKHLDPEVAGKLMAHIAKEEPSERRSDTLTESPQPLLEPLSHREKEILRLLTKGLSNPEIGEQLQLAAGTVRNYVSEILTKLDVSDRTQAAVKAVKLGIL